MPADLATPYRKALENVPELVAGAARADWDDWYCGAALAAVAAAKGFPVVAEAILELDPRSTRDFLKRKADE